MDPITAVTRGGTTWTPEFAVALDSKKCIGCGRCYKVCTRSVLELIDRSEEDISEDDDDDSESISSIMAITDAMDCTGCGACSRVCPKGCLTHSPMPMGA
jgi:Nif-specific ferredoxin III